MRWVFWRSPAPDHDQCQELVPYEEVFSFMRTLRAEGCTDIWIQWGTE